MMSGTAIHFDHHSAEYSATRDELLRQLRTEQPVAWSDAHGGFWVVTPYDLVRKVIIDDVNFTVEHIPGGRGGLTIPEADRPRIIPGETDGEEHAQYRKAVGETFSRPVVAKQRAWIRELVEGFVDQVIERREFDAVTDFAQGIPCAVVLRYLRLQVDDPERFFQAAERAVGVKIEEGAQLDETDVQADIKAVWDALYAAVVAKRAKPDDGVISYLATKDPPLDDLEIRDVIVSVVLGGARTTAALIENMLWQLEVDREMRATLANDMSLIPKAVDEFMRFFSPSQVIARTAVNDVELGGVQIRKGDRVLVSWHSANHDEAVYQDPESIRFDRRAKPHVGFGVGPHFCLGTWLAKAEAEITLETVLTRMPDYSLDLEQCRRYDDGLINQWSRMRAFADGKRD
jgi:cytochrome P450